MGDFILLVAKESDVPSNICPLVAEVLLSQQEFCKHWSIAVFKGHAEFEQIKKFYWIDDGWLDRIS